MEIANEVEWPWTASNIKINWSLALFSSLVRKSDINIRRRACSLSASRPPESFIIRFWCYVIRFADLSAVTRTEGRSGKTRPTWHTFCDVIWRSILAGNATLRAPGESGARLLSLARDLWYTIILLYCRTLKNRAHGRARRYIGMRNSTWKACSRSGKIRARNEATEQ